MHLLEPSFLLVGSKESPGAPFREAGAVSPVFVEGVGASGSLQPTGTQPESGRRAAGDSTSAPEPEVSSARPSIGLHLSIRRAAREAAKALRVSRVGIWRFEEPGSLLRLVTRYNRSEGSVQEDQLHPKRLASAFRSLLNRTSALAVDDTQRIRVAEPVQEWLEDAGIRAILAIPVREDDRLVGLATFEEGRSPREWTPEDRHLAAALILPLVDLLQGVVYAPGEPREVPSSEAKPELADRLTPREPPVAVHASPQKDVRKIGHLEAVTLLGAQEIIDLLAALDVQTAYLRVVS